MSCDAGLQEAGKPVAQLTLGDISNAIGKDKSLSPTEQRAVLRSALILLGIFRIDQ